MTGLIPRAALILLFNWRLIYSNTLRRKAQNQEPSLSRQPLNSVPLPESLQASQLQEHFDSWLSLMIASIVLATNERKPDSIKISSQLLPREPMRLQDASVIWLYSDSSCKAGPPSSGHLYHSAIPEDELGRSGELGLPKPHQGSRQAADIGNPVACWALQSFALYTDHAPYRKESPRGNLSLLWPMGKNWSSTPDLSGFRQWTAHQ